MVDAHDIAERSRLIAHRAYADAITAETVEHARKLLEAREHAGAATAGERLWIELLSKDLRQILDQMTADTPEGRLLRSNSPFSLVLGIADEVQRRQIWKQAKAELITETSLDKG